MSFEVQQVSTYDKTAFPTAAVYGAVPDRGPASDHLRWALRSRHGSLPGQRRRLRHRGGSRLIVLTSDSDGVATGS
jgi:hypothetical protein